MKSSKHLWMVIVTVAIMTCVAGLAIAASDDATTVQTDTQPTLVGSTLSGGAGGAGGAAGGAGGGATGGGGADVRVAQY